MVCVIERIAVKSAEKENICLPCRRFSDSPLRIVYALRKENAMDVLLQRLCISERKRVQLHRITRGVMHFSKYIEDVVRVLSHVHMGMQLGALLSFGPSTSRFLSHDELESSKDTYNTH